MPITGSNMQTADYQELKKYAAVMSEDMAKLLINRIFGFEIGTIKLINKAGHNAPEEKKYVRIIDEDRPALYLSDTSNYIRFDVRNWYYELVNGKLYPYYC